MEKIIVLDTETTNDLDCPLVYDLGFIVMDNNGKIYKEFSFVVADVFLDSQLMESAYFKDKIPQYWKDIKDGKRKLATFRNIQKIFADTCKEYEIKKVFAHNCHFDYLSLQTTQRFLTASKYRYFFPYGVEMWCTLKMARKLFKDNDEYGEYCYEHKYLTKRGQRRYTAEILYRFLHKDNNFIESHTGLEDVKIEKDIYLYCIRIDENINGKLWDDE